MYTRTTLFVSSAATLTVGFFCGFQSKDPVHSCLKDLKSAWSKHTPDTIKNKIATKEVKGLVEFLPIPHIHALTTIQPLPTTPSIVEESSKSKSRSTNQSQLSKLGYPSYENLRSFEDYIVCYDRRNKNPNWVLEHLTKNKVTVQGEIKRADVFKEDGSIHDFFRSTNEDYKNSGYDRGHLAAAGNHRWSQNAMDETFYLSNISPQVGKGFNRDAWNQLEKLVRSLVRKNKNTYVLTGPLYLPRKEDGKMYVKYEVIGRNHVSVPTHFFKVVLCENDQGQYQLLSFLMPNKALPDNTELKKYLVPVDIIERAAGLLIFNSIPRKQFKLINGIAVS